MQSIRLEFLISNFQAFYLLMSQFNGYQTSNKKIEAKIQFVFMLVASFIYNFFLLLVDDHIFKPFDMTI